MNTNWLRKYRDKFGWSQEELASKLQLAGFDVSRASISHWESNKYNAPLEDPLFRQALANIFRISVPDLLIAAGYEIEIEQSEQARRAAWIIDNLPQSERELALKILEQFLENTKQQARA